MNNLINIKNILIMVVILIISTISYYKYQEYLTFKENYNTLLKNNESLKLSNKVLEESLNESNKNKEILVDTFDNKILIIKENTKIVEDNKQEIKVITEKIKKIEKKQNFKEFFKNLKEIEEIK